MNTMVKKLVGEKMYFVTIIRDGGDVNGNPVYRVNVYSNTGCCLNSVAKTALKLREGRTGLRVISFNISKSVDRIVEKLHQEIIKE